MRTIQELGKILYITSSMMYAKGMKVLIPNNVMVWPQIGSFDQVQEVQYQQLKNSQYV
jgi:hypothetical protein